MKNLFLILVLFLGNYASAQLEITSGNYKENPKMLKNQYVNDTIWVWDSIQTYIINHVDSLDHYYTYLVQARNDIGNQLLSRRKPNYNYNGTIPNETLDTITYFPDKETTKRYTTSIWHETWNVWAIEYLSEYNENGLTLDRYDKYYSNTEHQFTNGNRRFNEYNSDDIVLFTNQKYNPVDDGWINSNKGDYYYDGYGNDTLISMYSWKNGSWVDSVKIVQVFTDSLLTRSKEYIIDDNQEWVEYSIDNRSYTSEGWLDTLHSLLYIDGTWEDDQKYIYAYDETGLDTTMVVMSFNHESSQLENFIKSRKFFTDSSRTYEYYYWDSELQDWGDGGATYYSYIMDNITDSMIGYTYYKDSNTFKADRLTVHRYNEKMLKIDRNRYYFWNNQWDLRQREIYFWSPFILNLTQYQSESIVTFYPNPASTHINFTNANAYIQLFSLSGQTILTSNQGESHISLEGIPSGVYIAIVTEEDQVIGIEKIVIRK